MTGPTRTAEVRWFGRGSVPPPVEAWFAALGDPPEPETRTDHYLAPTSAALGVKWREGPDGPAVEAKRREAVGDALQIGHAQAPVETWAKWSLSVADEADAPVGWIAVEKSRRQHRLGTETEGCAVEVTALVVAGETWWTVGLEATAPDDATRRRLLGEGARRWLGRADAPALGADAAMGYPAWLLARAG